MAMQNVVCGRWGRLLLLGSLGMLLLRAQPAAGQDPGETDVPSGTVAFFVGDEKSCPIGWRVATELRGRLAVAVTSADTVGTQVGDELQSEEDRTHSHAFTAEVELPYKPLAALNGGNNQGAAAAKYTSSGTSEAAASALPFIQLLTCVKP